MRVHVVDPSSFTPPYDHALCAALAARGRRRRAGHEPLRPRRRAASRRLRAARVLLPLAALGARRRSCCQHVPDMLRERRRPRRRPTSSHFQWLPVQHVDAHLLPKRPARADRARRDAARAAARAARRPAPPLRPRRRRRRPHRARPPPAGRRARRRRRARPRHRPRRPRRPRATSRRCCRRSSPAPDRDAPRRAVLRPAAPLQGPRRPARRLARVRRRSAGRAVDRRRAADGRRGAARASPATVRLVPRFVSDAEAAAVLRPRDLVVLPYREIEQSGVLFTAVGLGTPVILSAVGGFAEVDGATLVPPGDRSPRSHAALAAAIAAPPAPVDPAPHALGRDRSRAPRPLRDTRAVITRAVLDRGRPARLRPGRLPARARRRSRASASARRARSSPGEARSAELPSVSLIVAALRRAGRDRREGRQRARARLPARAAGGDRRLRRLARRHRRARPRRRRRSRARAAARRQDPRPGRRRRARARRDRRVLRRQRAVGAGRAAALVAPFADAARRLRLRPGALRQDPDGAGAQPGGPVLALRDGAARARSRAGSVTAGNGAIYATRRVAYIVVDPVMGHDLSLPFNMVKRGWRARLRAGGARDARRWCRRSRASSRASGG